LIGREQTKQLADDGTQGGDVVIGLCAPALFDEGRRAIGLCEAIPLVHKPVKVLDWQNVHPV